MYHLRLFHQSDPSRQIESRLLEAGELTVGRDPGVGWKVDDPDRAISRSHCVFSLSGGQLTVRDISSNGIFLGARTEPAPKGQAIPIQSGETIRFGRFNIVVEDASGASFQKEPIIDSFSGTGGLTPGSSPFAPPAGMAEHGNQRRAANPFGAELPRDPLAFDAPRAEPPLPSFNDDAWQQKPVRKAGDWDAPARGQPDGHEHLIGSQRHWTTPPPAPVGEVGFGFDAPFVRPILQTPQVQASDLAIPDDWDTAPTPPYELGGSRGAAQPVVAPAPAPVAAPAPPPEPVAPRPAAFEPPPPPPQPVFEAPPVAPIPVTPPVAPPAEIIPPIIPDDFAAAPSASPAPEPEPEPPTRAAPVGLTFFEPPPPQAAPPAEPPRAEAPAPAPAVEAPAPKPAAAASATPDANELFEAFCAGAKLNPALFAREDRVQLMHNLGAVYQQMVLGLGDLLSERTSVKNEYRMVRTTVRPEGNNPFKWSPPSRVAVDLLRTSDDGFLTGPPAVKESFEDLKKHLLCLLAGLRAALSSTLDTLHPENIESRLEGGGLFGPSKGSRAWAEYRRVYADFKKQADDNPDSQINRDFRAAYEKQLGALDSLKPPR